MTADIPTSGLDAAREHLTQGWVEPADGVTHIGASSGDDPYEPAILRKGVASRIPRVLGVLLAVAVVAAISLQTLVFDLYTTPTRSMEPTLECGDIFLVDKLSYRRGAPARYDVVVARLSPRQDAVQGSGTQKSREQEAVEAAGGQVIKRVIGLPGERVETRNGRVTIDGRMLREPYVAGSRTDGLSAVTLRSNEYLLLGDNRADSLDGRVYGAISARRITGRVALVVWPISHAGRLLGADGSASLDRKSSATGENCL